MTDYQLTIDGNAEPMRRSVIYVLLHHSIGQVKIGWTENLRSRLKAHRRQQGRDWVLWFVIDGDRVLEQWLHNTLRDARVMGTRETYELRHDDVTTLCRSLHWDDPFTGRRLHVTYRNSTGWELAAYGYRLPWYGEGNSQAV